MSKLLLPILVLASVMHAAPPVSVKVYTTAQGTEQRLTPGGPLRFTPLPQPKETDLCVFVDPKKTFQTVLGIGGALTDASAETLAKLPPEKRDELIAAYYDREKGIGYSLGRTHINSCDFSSSSYTYVKDGDTELASFSIAPDLKYRIPMIRAALAKAKGELTLFASPWSPPAWMKDNNDMLHGGKLKPEFRAAWANYFAKFLQAYQDAGVPIWGVTVQNEPMAVQIWESCIFTAEDERAFVRDHLGPTFARTGLGDKKIIIWDHNRLLLYQRASGVLDDPAAAKYVWGVGFHWYVNDSFANVARVREAYPNVNLLFTEGCNYPFDFTKLNDWSYGETYGRSMVNDFNNGAVGWTDWNILLDETGGPNHVKNFCLAPVHADTRTGELHYTNSFYYIGHFSKFIRPGAKRIISSSMHDDLLTTAFQNPDGSLAVVILNCSAKPLPFKLWIDGQAADASSPAHSIVTLVTSTK
jgi:glucosylceramidase